MLGPSTATALLTLSLATLSSAVLTPPPSEAAIAARWSSTVDASTNSKLHKRGCFLGILCFGSSSSGSSSSTSSGINLLTDNNNCGLLGTVCALESWAFGLGATCQSGICGPASCIDDLEFNWLTGKCISVQADNSNCGSCGTTCATSNVANSLAVQCNSGKCQATSCAAGYKVSSGACVIDTTSNVNSCGSAGKCPTSWANGASSSVCVNSVCKASSCNTGYSWDATYHFCRDVRADNANCGACGTTCTTSSITGSTAVQCSASTCKASACKSGYTLSSGTCKSLSASQKARAKRAAPVKPATLCPSGETACPILGSASYDLALAHHFSASQDFSAFLNGAGGYECLDTRESLESCGGCASTGEGQDCSKIRAAVGTTCDSGACIVFSCAAGWRPNLSGTGCVRLHGDAHSPSNATRRHLSAAKAHAHAHSGF